MGPLRASVRIFVTCIWTLALLPLQVISVALGARLAERVPQLYYAGLCRILGIVVRVAGSPVKDRPALFIANHSSWLDIPVLGGVVEGAFVAKADVARWPGVGLLARLQRTVFVERIRQRADAHARQLGERLSEDARLMLFPEGTSTDGSYVLPFKSTLFSAVERAPLHARPVVQPVTVAYVRIGGLPADQRTRPTVAWYGDMTFVPHVWGVFQLGSVNVDVTFHEPVPESCFRSRKTLAAHCEAVVASEHSRLIGNESGQSASSAGVIVGGVP